MGQPIVSMGVGEWNKVAQITVNLIFITCDLTSAQYLHTVVEFPEQGPW